MKNTGLSVFRIGICTLCLLLAAVFLAGSFLALAQTSQDLPPIAQNLDFTTFRDVPLVERFSAVDPEGGAVTFEIVTRPKRGAAMSNEDGTFVYTPRGRFRGRDSFCYVAVDACGNVSPKATVRINVIKQR